MPPPYSRGDRVKCLATMWDLSDSDEDGGSSADNAPDKFSESHFARTGNNYVYGTVQRRLKPFTKQTYSVRWDAMKGTAHSHVTHLPSWFCVADESMFAWTEHHPFVCGLYNTCR